MLPQMAMGWCSVADHVVVIALCMRCQAPRVKSGTSTGAKPCYDFLARVSSEIINTVDGVNRCVYDISSKPPSTIEWE